MSNIKNETNKNIVEDPDVYIPDDGIKIPLIKNPKEFENKEDDQKYNDFKVSFRKKFDYKSQITTKTGSSFYPCRSFYYNGEFCIRYTIGKKRYSINTPFSAYKENLYTKTAFKKLIILNQVLQRQDKAINEIKPIQEYYYFNFFIFREILMEYAFIAMSEKENCQLDDLNLDLMDLLKNEKFQQILLNFSQKTIEN